MAPDLGEAFTLRLCEQLLAADLGDADHDTEKSGILLQYVKVRLVSVDCPFNSRFLDSGCMPSVPSWSAKFGQERWD